MEEAAAAAPTTPTPHRQVAGFHLESVELDLSDVKCFVLEAAGAGRADGSVEGSQINSDLRRLTIEKGPCLVTEATQKTY